MWSTSEKPEQVCFGGGHGLIGLVLAALLTGITISNGVHLCSFNDHLSSTADMDFVAAKRVTVIPRVIRSMLAWLRVVQNGLLSVEALYNPVICSWPCCVYPKSSLCRHISTGIHSVVARWIKQQLAPRVCDAVRRQGCFAALCARPAAIASTDNVAEMWPLTFAWISSRMTNFTLLYTFWSVYSLRSLHIHMQCKFIPQGALQKTVKFTVFYSVIAEWIAAFG